MDLLKILVPLFFVSFSLGEIARVQFPNSITIGLFDVSVVLLSVYILAKTRKSKFALKIPIIETTTKSSIRVKPFFMLLIVYLV